MRISQCTSLTIVCSCHALTDHNYVAQAALAKGACPFGLRPGRHVNHLLTQRVELSRRLAGCVSSLHLVMGVRHVFWRVSRHVVVVLAVCLSDFVFGLTWTYRAMRTFIV